MTTCLTLAHLSDIHVGGAMDRERLMHVAALTAAQRSRVDLYRPVDVTGDGQVDGLMPLSAACVPTQATGAPVVVQCAAGLDRLRAAAPVITLDELHKYAKWKSWLKGLFDSYGDRARFIVTGSSRLDVFKRANKGLH